MATCRTRLTLTISACVLACSNTGARAQQGAPPQELLASDAAAEDLFGGAVAVSGDTLLVGARSDDDAGASSGAVYAFRWTGDAWVEEDKLVPTDGDAGDVFGFDVAIDGATAVIGAMRDDDNGLNAGAVYVFERDGTTWVQQQKLTPTDGDAGDSFGYAVSISKDTIVVGARDHDGPGGAASGAAYVFTRAGGVWTEQAKLVASDALASDVFGHAVAVAGDTAVIGAPGVDANGSASGAAYVFHRAGGVWTPEPRLFSSDIASNDSFGSAVAVAGARMVIGARNKDLTETTDSGAAYIFTASGTSWTETVRLTPSTPVNFGQFGGAVAIAGNLVLIGDKGSGSAPSNAGAAYLFDASRSWLQCAVYRGQPGDTLGVSIDIDGDTAVLGAEFATRAAGMWQGAATVVDRVGAWARVVEIPNPSPHPMWGQAIAIDGDTAVIGAPADGEFGESAGAAFVYVRVGAAWVQQGKLTRATLLGAGVAFENFGVAVDISGDTVVVGTLGDYAYTFTRTGGVWSGEQDIPTFEETLAVAIDGDSLLLGMPFADAGDGWVLAYERTQFGWEAPGLPITIAATGGLFGSDVDLEGDTFVAGAPDGFPVGRAFVFTKNAGTWTQRATLDSINGAAGFAQSVSLDGDTIAVGGVGAVEIFTGGAASWSREQSIFDPFTALLGDFGVDVAVENDTLTVVEAVTNEFHVFSRAGGAWESIFVTAGAGISLTQTAISGDVVGWVAHDREQTPGVVGSAFLWNGNWASRDVTTTHLASTNGGQADLGAAVAGAQPVDGLAAAYPAFHDMGTIGLGAKALTIESDAEIRQAYTGDLTLADGASLVAARDRDAIFYGALTVPGGATVELDADAARFGADAFLLAGQNATLIVRGDLDVAIRSPGRFQVADAQIIVDGQTTQYLETTGPGVGGERAADDTPAVGSLQIAAGAVAELIDARDNNPLVDGVEALIVGALIIDAGATLNTNGCPVYYETLTNNGSVDDPNNLIQIVQCPADLTGDGQVDGADLGLLLGAWGGPGASDLTGDGNTDGADLGLLLGAWGACP